MSRIIATFGLCFVLTTLVACGGGGSSSTPTPTPPSSLVVSPGSASVAVGASQTFTANVSGVTWNVSGPGTITQSGVYSAPSTFPSPNTATITATAGGQSGSATAAVVFPNNNQSFQSGAIKLGTSGGNVLDTSSTACCIGTLGSLINRGGTLFILSDNHVLDQSGRGTPGTQINQPGPTGCFTLNKTVANLTDGAALKPMAGSDPAGCQGSTAPVCGKSPSNTDSAIAAIVAGQVDTSGSILDLGPAGSTSISDAPPSAAPFVGLPSAGQQVAKSGRTSSLTCSTVQGVSGDFRVSYDASCGGAVAFDATFNNQIVVNGGSFLQSGDSGSLLVTADTARALGLLFAGNDTSAVANPIGTVLAQFASGGVTPVIAGSGPDHAVSCAPTQSIAGAQVGIGAASTLTPQQRNAAASARDRHAGVLRADPAVRSVSAGVSADSPAEGAVVIELNGAPSARIPATLDGVRTRVIYAGTPPAPTSAQVESTIAVKQAHRDSVMSSRGVQGIAVGRSDDNPAEPALLVYTIKGVAHDPIPATIDGVRTKVIEGTRFHAK